MTIFQDTRATSLVQRARMSWVPLSLVVALHAAALWSLFRNEFGVLAVSLFLVSWIGLNCCFLVVFRRPAIAALFSLTIVELIILLSKFKFDVTWMTISAMDILMVDPDTVAFLLGIFPELKFSAAMAALILVAASGLLWRFDTFRVRRRVSAGGGALCLGGLVLLANFSIGQPWEPFQGVNHVSNFFRTGIVSVSELVIRGFFDADASTPDRLAIADDTCPSAVKRPHIIMILDESAFDASTAKQVHTLPDYEQHFRSFDGKKRALLVETTGGSTWLSEYSALTGTSARSFGRLQFYVTRIAAGRVERGLPNALKRCGYKTTSLYPAHGAFLSARYFQTNIGVDNFVDAKQMGAGEVEPDRFYYDQAARRIANERGGAPLFMFVYTTLNHFPWDKRYRPELTPDWRETKNPLVADEYLRRQSASARDYLDFKARLKRDFPAESFLIVRFGDHQPNIGPQLLDPLLPESEISRRIAAYDSRYFTTYYVLDTVNFDPIDTQSARDNLEIAHLPLVVQEAAGLPLDPSFAEQKKILQRCDGLFYRCRDGAEARRFNRLLLDAGLIKRL